MEKIVIKEAVVVEGRDDVSAVSRAADALVIATHGFGISKESLDLIAKAYHNQGIIILTDPDRAGENIRRRLLKLFPEAGQAFLSRDQAEKAGDIGIENASPEDIARALLNARWPEGTENKGSGAGAPEGSGRTGDPSDASYAPVTMEDLDALGLAGGMGASERREKLGKILGIGTGNAKAFLKKINGFRISREELITACRSMTAKEQ